MTMSTREHFSRVASKLTEHDELIDRNSAAVAELRALVAQADTVPQNIRGSGGMTFVPTTWGTSATGAPPTGTVPEFVLTAVAAMLLVLTDHAGSYEIHHGQDLDTHRQMLAEIGTLTDWLGGVLWDDAQARAVELYTRITT